MIGNQLAAAILGLPYTIAFGGRTTFQYDTVSASPKNLLTTVIGPTGCQTPYGYATFTLAGTTSDWLMNKIVDPNGFQPPICTISSAALPRASSQARASGPISISPAS